MPRIKSHFKGKRIGRLWKRKTLSPFASLIQVDAPPARGSGFSGPSGTGRAGLGVLPRSRWFRGTGGPKAAGGGPDTVFLTQVYAEIFQNTSVYIKYHQMFKFKKSQVAKNFQDVEFPNQPCSLCGLTPADLKRHFYRVISIWRDKTKIFDPAEISQNICINMHAYISYILMYILL